MDFTEWALARVASDLAEAEARQNAGRLAPEPVGEYARNGNSVSTVFTVRLDRREHAALVDRAAALDVRPSVLARNFIRAGLTRPRIGSLEALARIDVAVAELRAAVQQS